MLYLHMLPGREDIIEINVWSELSKNGCYDPSYIFFLKSRATENLMLYLGNIGPENGLWPVLGVKPLPEPMLTFVIYTIQTYFIAFIFRIKYLIKENEFENAICKPSLRLQCFKNK